MVKRIVERVVKIIVIRIIKKLLKGKNCLKERIRIIPNKYYIIVSITFVSKLAVPFTAKRVNK